MLTVQVTETISCTPEVRTLNFRFRPVLRWLAEPLLRRRMAAEVDEEVRLAKQYLQQGSRP